MSPPMEHRVEVNLGSPFAAPILPTGLSLLDNLEAAAREDAVNGEPADNNPSSVAAVDAAGTSSAGQPLTSTSSILLLTQGGESWSNSVVLSGCLSWFLCGRISRARMAPNSRYSSSF